MSSRKKLSLNTSKDRDSGFDTLSVVLLDESCIKGSLLKKSLLEFNYNISEYLDSRSSLESRVVKHAPDVLIIGVDLPDDSILDSIASLNEVYPLPIVMFAEQGATQFIKRVVRAGISAFIVDDLQPQRLPSIITIAIERFRINKALIEELDQTKNKLAERKIVDKAKGLLMKQQGIDENNAYKKLQKLSMDKGQSLSEISQGVIDAFELIAL